MNSQRKSDRSPKSSHPAQNPPSPSIQSNKLNVQKQRAPPAKVLCSNSAPRWERWPGVPLLYLVCEFSLSDFNPLDSEVCSVVFSSLDPSVFTANLNFSSLPDESRLKTAAGLKTFNQNLQREIIHFYFTSLKCESNQVNKHVFLLRMWKKCWLWRRLSWETVRGVCFSMSPIIMGSF